ncbi:MAG: PKD domain-containing protein [Bacteroidota bacterium]
MIILAGSFFDASAQKVSEEKLEAMFYDYKIVTIDSRNMHQTSRNNHFFEVDIPKQQNDEVWRVELHNSGLIADDYISQYTTETGVETVKGTSAIPTKGQIVGRNNTTVSLTFNDNFVYGFIKDKTGYNYIEPLYYYDQSQKGKDLYVIYNADDLKPSAPYTCGVRKVHNHTKEISNHANQSKGTRLDECYEVDYAIANDFLMFQEFGSVVATEDHAIGVTNNVQTNYDDEFADELQLIIVTQYTATSDATDPWTSSTNAGTLLNSFRSWAPGGFAAVHDVGSLWTDRDFNGSTVGIAYLGVICTGSRYNCLMNFTNNSNTKRMMVAHELGHNFNASHDSPGNTIMAPSVNGSNTWSTTSVNTINSHIASRWCLSDCAGSSGPPTASFTYDVIEECTPGLVQFTNESTGSGTLSYAWEFPGGIPSFSTEENPLVSYLNGGSFNVSLTVTNTSGSDEDEQFGIINIIDSPIPDFSYSISGTIVSFFNFSQNATSYFWDFGDGITSNFSDPVHDFLDDGVYVVELTAFSDCGNVSKEEIIVIANPPTAGFIADVEEGCAELTVQFTSTSSNNTDDFLWSFEGGNPAISSEENPTVTYSDGGSFDVTLTVINETGDDILTLTDFIEVNDIPLADFSYEINGDEVTFTNFTEGADTYSWDFGDGNSSTEENPVHTYANDGDFEVVLTVTNECGENNVSSTVSISLAPIASFDAVQEPTDCATFVIDFQNTSTNNPDSFEWVFEGGDPVTSTEENPSVTYTSAGEFDVTLTVTNANGSNTINMPDYVIAFDEPISAFTYSEDGLMVTFVDGSLDADVYSWDFGDGNMSSEVNPVHEYAAEGIYTVILEVTNQCGSNITTQTINNYTPVEADFSSDITDGCANLVVGFEDSSSENVTEWFWTFEGGTPATSTEENPTVTYESAGQYDVVLTVSHPESSETITLVNYIAVTDVPITSFEYFDDILTVDFTNTTVEGTTYAWDFGDGNTSTEESPSHTYDAEGMYTVKLTATNSCGTTESMQTLMVNALPTAGIGAETVSGCGPLTVQFNDESSSNVTEWAWTFTGGNPSTSSDPNPVVEYANPGTYEVELVVTAPAGTDMLVIDDYIEVLGGPNAEIDYTLDGNVINATNIGSMAADVSWSVDGVVIDENELEYTFPENGIYTVELTTENVCGTDTESVEVEVNVYPEALLDNFPITVCAGDEVQLVDNSTNADEKAWTIFGANPGTSNEDSPTVIYDVGGVFSISLTVSNQYGESSKNFIDVVNVIGLPSATFTGAQADNTVDFMAEGTNVTEYFWEFGDGTTSTEQNPFHEFTTNGMFEVKLTVSNECGEYEVTETFTINSNSVTEAELADVKIYPNPAQSDLTIELINSESDQIKIDILDIGGRLIKSAQFNSSIYTMDVSEMSAGTYLIRLRSEEASYFKKVAVIK